MSFPLVKRSADFSRGPSASIWAPFNTADFIRNRDLGFEMWTDFITDTGPFYLWQDGTDSTDFHGATDLYGGIVRCSSTTDNDACQILTIGQVEFTAATTALVRLNHADGSGFMITDTAGAEGMMAYEIRLRQNYTGSNANVFVGLTQGNIGGAVGDIMSIADAMIDIDFLGFESKAASPTTWDVIYRLGGASEFEVITDVYSTTSKPGGIVGTTNNTLVSSLGKWIKLGFLFDPNATTKTDGTNADRIKFFVNGEPCNPATAIIDAGSSDPGIAASNFPDGRGMFPSVVLMNSGGGDANMDVDWIRCAQFFPNGDERAPAV